MTDEELKTKLELHRKWLCKEAGGVWLDLTKANLAEANLTRANLHGANLTEANLTEANLARANLSWADLICVNLFRANLSRVNLTEADLSKANLTETDLSEANLFKTDLSEANLTGADLTGANLSGANLVGANLSGADLRRATGNMKEIKSMQIDTYSIVWWWNGDSQRLAIGCQSHPVEAWKNFSDVEIRAMDGTRALDWWRKWKNIVLEIVEMSPAVRWDQP